ncbi:MAG: hypothetical protein IJH91_01715 [Mogibacterium sp.]|nr:hypothetical protein [Mogibacterium sp.]
MIDILEKDKDRLLTDLAKAATAEKAVHVLENESDKMLLTYNEHCGSESERDAAAYMMQAVRLSLPLIDSVGDTKVWESETVKESERKVSIPGIILMILGIALTVFGLVVLAAAGSKEGVSTDVLMRCLIVLGGAAMMYFAGRLTGKPAKVKRTKSQQIEVHIDPGKVYRSFRTAILSVDQSLEEVRAAERWSKREKAGTIEGRPATTPEIDLFSDLLAASYIGDAEYALEKIDSIKYYLHRQQIEVVDFSEATRQYFDLMPGTEAGTIRPALVADGVLLKKGLASTGK